MDLLDNDTAGTILIASLLLSPVACFVFAFILAELRQLTAAVRTAAGSVLGAALIGPDFGQLPSLTADDIQFAQLLLVPIALDGLRSIIEHDTTQARTAAAWLTAAAAWAAITAAILIVATSLDTDPNGPITTSWVLSLQIIAGIEAATTTTFAVRSLVNRHTPAPDPATRAREQRRRARDEY